MNDDAHVRCRSEVIKGETSSDSRQHLEQCSDCARFARRFERALDAMSSSLPPMPPGLAARVVERVRDEADRDLGKGTGAVAVPRRPRLVLDPRLRTVGRIAAVVVAVTLIAFGLLPLLGGEDAAAALRQAAQRTAAQGTARIALRTVIEGHSTSPAIPSTRMPPDFSIITELQGSAAFHGAMHAKGSVEVRGNAPDASLMHQEFDLLISQGATYDVSAAGLSKRTAAPPVGQGIEGPDSVLEMLRAGADGEIANLGAERLAGIPVSHYRFELPTAALLSPFSSSPPPGWVAEAWIAAEGKTLQQFSATAQGTAASPSGFRWRASLRGTLSEFGSRFDTPRGSITSDGSLVLPLEPGRTLAQYENRAATGRSVVIQSVVGDESFWVGPTRRNRLLIRLAAVDESPPDFRRGDSVDFVGTVRQLSAQARSALELTPAEGLQQLREQGHYIQVPFDKLDIA